VELVLTGAMELVIAGAEELVLTGAEVVVLLEQADTARMANNNTVKIGMMKNLELIIFIVPPTYLFVLP
jgi:hypothetical protein